MLCPRRSETGNSVFKLPEEDEWRGEGHCSYCGSMAPDALMVALREGSAELTPTDKDYKVYVESPALGHRKFYFQHFDESQKHEFIDLLNAKRLRVARPGYFYVMPYFIAMS